jgi:hypothetical protein
MMKCVALVAVLVAGVADAGGPVYIGCYADSCDSSKGGELQRDLPTFSCSVIQGVYNYTTCGCNGAAWAAEKAMTPTICSAICYGFKFFGLQGDSHHVECFCGNDYGTYGKVSESECSSPCTGDPSIMCGAPDRNSIYAQPNGISKKD